MTPLLTPKSGISAAKVSVQEKGALLKYVHPNQSTLSKTSTLRPAALHVLPMSFGQDALDLVCDPSVWL
jgi:hypothetical protein